jgi:hypothetical protein
VKLEHQTAVEIERENRVVKYMMLEKRPGVSGSQNCNLELSHAHLRDEESYDSPGWQFPARRR